MISGREHDALEDAGYVVIEVARAEAMCRLLIDSGDMTPMARMQLRKLWEPRGGRR